MSSQDVISGKFMRCVISFAISITLSPAHLDVSSVPQVTRILTRCVNRLTSNSLLTFLPSGQAPTAPSSDALPTLRTLIRTASRMPSAARILVGSGINTRTVGPLLSELLPCGLREVHLSGGGWTSSEMTFRREGMGMGIGGDGEWGVWRTDKQRIREVRGLVDAAWNEFVRQQA